MLDKLHSHVVCLGDADRSSRIRSLNFLSRELFKAAVPMDTSSRFIAEHLIDALVERLVSDPVEKCRELAMSIIESSAREVRLEDLATLGKRVIPAACPRLGRRLSREPVEELRLRLIELCSTIFVRCAVELELECGDLAEYFVPSLIESLADTYPEAKRAAIIAVSNVSRVAPDGVHVFLTDLAQGLVANLTHQHAKTRTAVLVSLANVMRASSISDLFPQVLHKVVLPALNNASLDRSASVRTQLAQSLGSLLVYNYGASRGGSLAAVTSVKSLLAFDVEILAALIAIVADETKQVSARAVAELNAAALRWHLSPSKAASNSSPEYLGACQKLSSKFINSLGSSGIVSAHLVSSVAAQLVGSHFSELLNIKLMRMNHWMPATRASGARALAVLTIVAKHAVNNSPSELRGLIPEFSKLLTADNMAVQNDGRIALYALFATLSDCAPVLEGLTTFMTGSKATISRTSAIDIISILLSATRPECVASHVGKIVHMLSVHAERNSEERHVAKFNVSLSYIDAPDMSLWRAIGSLLSLEPELGENALVALVRTLLLSPTFSTLLANPKPSAADTLAVHAIFFLVEQTNSVSLSTLAETHLDALIAYLPEVPPCYEAGSAAWVLVDALVRLCPNAVTSALSSTVGQVLLTHAKPTSNSTPEANISALCLLHALVLADARSLLSRDNVSIILDRHIVVPRGGTKLSECPQLGVIVPNVVWSAGHMAATARKSALALLHALLQAEVASAGMKQGTWLVHSASKLFPVLRSSLEEFDTSSREISLSCLASLFKLLPHACLEHTEIDLLYPALIKRLDDSIDRVRVEACATLTEFFRVAMPQILGVALEYCAEHLLIHLDDPSLEIQSSVFGTVSALACLDESAASVIANKIRGVQASHRDPALCDKLIQGMSARR
mmetsp:Transcript_30447/g.99843  ORF Transcript_30447/g.99843 Transcript_30447/m.99843 type:complete len:909 (+) Transcript_30447:76-2802(+)